MAADEISLAKTPSPVEGKRKRIPKRGRELLIAGRLRLPSNLTASTSGEREDPPHAVIRYGDWEKKKEKRSRLEKKEGGDTSRECAPCFLERKILYVACGVSRESCPSNFRGEKAAN